jgi:hypothetical protein
MWCVSQRTGRDQQPLQGGPISPAAAFEPYVWSSRIRLSDIGMRRDAANGFGQLVDADALKRLAVVAAPVVAPSPLKLGTHEGRRSFVHLAIDLGELRERRAPAEVMPPPWTRPSGSTPPGSGGHWQIGARPGRTRRRGGIGKRSCQRKTGTPGPPTAAWAHSPVTRSGPRSSGSASHGPAVESRSRPGQPPGVSNPETSTDRFGALPGAPRRAKR